MTKKIRSVNVNLACLHFFFLYCIRGRCIIYFYFMNRARITLSMVELGIKLVEPQFSRTAVVLLKFDAHTLDDITFRTLDLRGVFSLFLSTNYV